MADEVLLKVEGMTCTNCASGISRSLKKAGFPDADANFSEGEVTFTLVEGKKRDEAVKNIEKLGYKVIEDAEPQTKGLSTIEKKFLWSAVFSLPLFLHMFVPSDWLLNDPIVQIALCTPVFTMGFIHFGRSGLGSIKGGMANMDVLIFTGSTAAFVYSLAGTLAHWGSPGVHDFMFFETAAMIITLVLLGNVIEHRAVKKTTERIGELTKLQSGIARIIMRINGKEKIFEADPRSVKIGDELQVNEGDHIPVDGKVLSGKITVDESAITGESVPVYKEEGDEVFSGTTVIRGNTRISAIKPTADSTLEEIIRLVKRARREQPEIQILGDKVSAIFVPIVLAISVLTFTLAFFLFEIGMTKSLMHAIAVLVISCPCAMGLATPTAVVAGIGRAAKKGILIKGGDTLERYALADTIIFDKTGTLTKGEFNITVTENELGSKALSIIKGLETHSSHPIASSLIRLLADEVSEPVKDPEEVKGLGMSGKLDDGTEVFFGKDPSGKSDLALIIAGRVKARLDIRDELKPNAKEMVAGFKAAGIRTIILSGDRKEKVEDVASTLGIDEWHADMKPDDKLRFIERLSSEEKVVMVGDGINDGPSLSRAQVGISPGGASSLAVESARVVIMHPNEMNALSDSYLIAKHTYRTIKQNLFWAFFYNVIAIPIAALGFLNPMIAALSMAFSDVMVIGNSLRLRVKKLR